MTQPEPCPHHTINELGCPECSALRRTYYTTVQDLVNSMQLTFFPADDLTDRGEPNHDEDSGWESE